MPKYEAYAGEGKEAFKKRQKKTGAARKEADKKAKKKAHGAKKNPFMGL